MDAYLADPRTRASPDAAAPSRECCQPSFSATWEKPGVEGTGAEILALPEAPTPPQQQTGNAQQFRRHKALMRNTAASCFPSTRARDRLPC